MFGFSAPSIDIEQFEPVSIDAKHEEINCACAALGLILAGNRLAGYYVQKAILELRDTPLHNLLDSLPGKDPLENKRSIDIVTNTDLRVFARHIKMNIYLYVCYPEERPRWECYTGTKKCAERAALYLKMIKDGGRDHVLVVYQVLPRTTPLPCSD